MLRELLLVFVLIAGSTADTRPLPDLPFRVIVHRENPVSSITRAELSAIYLRRLRSWPGGEEIVPVDQPASSRVRERFSRRIHGKSVAYVTRYWQRVTFSGRGVPPVKVRSSEEVIELVKKKRGAIGYIDRDVTAGDEVKVIEVAR